MKALWQAEPAVIVSLVAALFAVGTSFGLSLSDEQVGAIMAVVSIVAGLLIRSQVTPVGGQPPPPAPPPPGA